MNNSNTQPNIATGFAQGNVSNVSLYTPDLNQEFLVKNWFRPGRVGMLVAPPAHGKTAIIAAICTHVALGKAIAGLKILRNSVYYLAPEDPDGVKDRAYGHLLNVPKGATPFYVVDRVPDLRQDDQIEGIIADVLKMKAKSQTKSAMVIIDTLNRSIGDADENSASAMGGVVNNAQRIAREADCYVLFVHHTPHGNSERGRGSSAFEANTDDTFLLKRDKQANAQKVVQLVPLKQKGVPLQPAIAFRIDAFKVGLDADGDEVTVPKAVALDEVDQPKIAASNLNRAPKAKSNADERQEDVLRALRQLTESTLQEWHETDAIKGLVGDPFHDARKKPASLTTAVRRALGALVECGDVEKNGRRYRMAQATQTEGEGTDYDPKV